jgi:hypothetical protein
MVGGKETGAAPLIRPLAVAFRASPPLCTPNRTMHTQQHRLLIDSTAQGHCSCLATHTIMLGKLNVSSSSSSS